MATRSTNAEVQKVASQIQEPSRLWCIWSALRGTNSHRLKVRDTDLHNKWIILTGGNSGIGHEAALLDTTIEWWECDMADLASVEVLAKRWLATGRPLDILANNAGMGGYQGEIQETRDGFEIVHQVNFLAHVLLTMFLLESLILAPEPRIVCTTSCMHYIGIFDLTNAKGSPNAYPNNKLYFQTWLSELQDRMLQHAEYRHVTIQGVHPGMVRTNIWKLPKDSASMTWLEWARGTFLRYAAIDSQQGSIAITHAATAIEYGPNPDTQNVGEPGGKGGGKYINRIWEQEPMPHTTHPVYRRKIWEFANEQLKLQDKGLLDKLAV